jgi:hypothetical protein
VTRDEEARYHMRACPSHEMIVGTDDDWHCLTCESQEEWQGLADSDHTDRGAYPVADTDHV